MESVITLADIPADVAVSTHACLGLAVPLSGSTCTSYPLNPTIRTMANIDEIVSSLAVVSNDCSGADRKSQSLDKGLGGYRPDTEHGIQLIRYLHKSQVV